MKKRVVVALGHRALGTTLPEQKTAVKHTAKCIADLIEEGYQVAITHSNAPQLGMIHTAMNEFAKAHKDYTPAPMSVCSAMSQGYIGYDLQNGIREELLNRGIYRTVSTVLTQVIVDPYDEAFYTPTKVLGRYMNAQEANEERKKGNYVIAGGDFNQTFDGMDTYPIHDKDSWVPGKVRKEDIPEGFSYAVSDNVPTCRLLNGPYSGNYDDSQVYVLDGFIVSDNLKIDQVENIDTQFEYTDHQPVKLNVTLK